MGERTHQDRTMLLRLGNSTAILPQRQRECILPRGEVNSGAARPISGGAVVVKISFLLDWISDGMLGYAKPLNTCKSEKGGRIC